MNLKQKRFYFFSIFKKAERKYGKYGERLAGEGWKYDWQTLVATIMSAQSRDETTIPIAENLFARYNSLEKLAKANYKDVFRILKSLNYNRTKAKHIIATAIILFYKHHGRVPDTIEELIELPGVGRKTANLVLSEVHCRDSVTIDTHCHRLLNVLGIVHTNNPYETEKAMMEIVPQKYWSRINRVFVLWGKEVRGRDKKTLLAALQRI